jgi:hypothetical protein
VSSSKIKPGFVEPMLLVRSEKLPEGAEWQYELKLDGYRALAIKSSGKVRLRSRNDNDFNSRYPANHSKKARDSDSVRDWWTTPTSLRRVTRRGTSGVVSRAVFHVPHQFVVLGKVSVPGARGCPPTKIMGSVENSARPRPRAV